MKKLCYVVTIPGTIRAFFIPQLIYLSHHGFEVSVICNDDAKIGNELGKDIKFIPVNVPRGVSFIGSITTIKKLTNIFKKEQFDLIQYSTPNAAFYASIAAKKAGCKVRNYHLMGFRYLGASGVGRFILQTLEKIACNNSTSIECVSKSNMELGIQEGLFSQDKVRVVWNGSTGGVDLNKFDFSKRQVWREEIRKELGYDKDDFVYGFVGRITRDKGINELLEAYFNLNNDSKLLLVGAMEDENSLDLNLLDRARNNSSVCIHDAVTDVERYFAAIDVLVLPSYREGFGNVVIEASAMGTPAIVSDIPGPRDAIASEVTGYLVRVKDIEDLSNKMYEIHRDFFSKDYTKVCSDFVRSHFDSKKLCEHILERKKYLLN